MTDQRQPPQSTVQAVGQAATDVIGGLRQQPMLLALVMLNVIGVGAAIFFLLELIKVSDTRWKQNYEQMDIILKSCLPERK